MHLHLSVHAPAHARAALGKQQLRAVGGVQDGVLGTRSFTDAKALATHREREFEQAIDLVAVRKACRAANKIR